MELPDGGYSAGNRATLAKPHIECSTVECFKASSLHRGPQLPSGCLRGIWRQFSTSSIPPSSTKVGRHRGPLVIVPGVGRSKTSGSPSANTLFRKALI